jgi:hypothetical protein
MLFLLIYLYWCPTRFQYQMMFLLYYRKTKTVTSITDISYSPPPGAPEFTPCSLYSSYCSIFVFCAVFYISQFVLLSVSLWPWYCLSFVSFSLFVILAVFCQFPFGHAIVCRLSVSLWPCYCLSFSASLWPRCCLSFTMYGFWLPLWYLQTFLALLLSCHMSVICFLK